MILSTVMKVKTRWLLFLVVSTLVSILIFIRMEQPQPQIEQLFPRRRITSQGESIVNTPTCFIPMMNAFGPMVKSFVRFKKQHQCLKYKYITFRDGYSVRINRTTVSKYYNSTFKHCSYIPFTKAGSSDKKYTIIWEKRQNFSESIQARHPFVFVFCYFRNDSLIEKQVYAFILRNKTSDKIMKERYKQMDNDHLPMNVLIFVFESTSRLNFVRHMNWTYSYITKELGAVEFYGYNKVGLNTFPNIVPVLLGISEAEMNYDDGYLDKYPFIWRNFSQAGYRTFYIEDGCSLGAFNYLKNGFAHPPVDHYLRTYLLAKEREVEPYYFDLCMENKLGVDVLMESTMEFIQVYKDAPHLVLTLMSSASHEDPAGLGLADLPYLKMLNSLQEEGSLENSVLIFLGDHGSRYGNIRNTFQGRLEENLPALYIVLPEWFRTKYQHFHSNMTLNARKLTNNYDIYATLMDIIKIGQGKVDYEHKGKHGKSLFRNILINRTCSDIGTPPMYCACSMYQDISTGTRLVRIVTNYSIQKLNGMLFIYRDLCAKLSLKNIISAQKSMISREFLREENTKIVNYVVTFEVSPSSAIFEVLLEFNFDTGKKKLLGDISRLNKYGKQPNCIRNKPKARKLEQYCYCINQ